MVDLRQQHLGLVARGDQIRRSIPDPHLQRGIQHLNFVAGLGDFAGVLEHGDGDATDDDDDDQSTDRRDPAKPGSVALLLGDPGRQPFVGDPDDA